LAAPYDAFDISVHHLPDETTAGSPQGLCDAANIAKLPDFGTKRTTDAL
jgi:hypothetical protein